MFYYRGTTAKLPVGDWNNKLNEPAGDDQIYMNCGNNGRLRRMNYFPPSMRVGKRHPPFFQSS